MILSFTRDIADNELWFFLGFSVHGQGNSPCIRNEPLMTHMPIAIVIIDFFLFQIAILRTHIRSMVLSRCIVEDVHAKYNQEFSGGNGQAGGDLGITEDALSSGSAIY
jgi:hypothetical protein